MLVFITYIAEGGIHTFLVNHLGLCVENTNSYFECASEAISNLPGLVPKSHLLP